MLVAFGKLCHLRLRPRPVLGEARKHWLWRLGLPRVVVLTLRVTVCVWQVLAPRHIHGGQTARPRGRVDDDRVIREVGFDQLLDAL